jgi:hypothetical protein
VHWLYSPIYHCVIKKRARAINGDKLSGVSNTKIDGTLISGLLILAQDGR